MSDLSKKKDQDLFPFLLVLPLKRRHTCCQQKLLQHSGQLCICVLKDSIVNVFHLGLADVGPFAETTADHVTEFYGFLLRLYLRCADDVAGNCSSRSPRMACQHVKLSNTIIAS